MDAIERAMVCLYLRGFPGASASRRRWPVVLGALRAAECKSLEAAQQTLRETCLSEEAEYLGDSRSWEYAGELLAEGQVLSPLHAAYPIRWRRSLGAGAPPVVWACGNFDGNIRYAAVVGTREPDAKVAKAISSAVREVGLMGFGIVSGGARGVDRLAIRAAQRLGIPTLEVLPFIRPMSGPAVSVHPAGARVGTATFMERNILIYALSEFAVVFGPRFKEGGTWHGAVEAHRRHLTPLLVFEEPQNLGARALIALGATGYSPKRGITDALIQCGSQRELPLAEPWG